MKNQIAKLKFPLLATIAVAEFILIIIISIYIVGADQKILRQHQQIEILNKNVDSLRQVIRPVQIQEDSIARLLNIERVKADTVN